jgi:cell division protein FtsW
VLVVAFVLMIASSDWRRERMFAYLDPWSEKHALGKGYQLSHSLIAIGRGEIFGVGLGGSVEKLHWLPEAHTDFLLAVIGEEFGLVGVLTLIVPVFLDDAPHHAHRPPGHCPGPCVRRPGGAGRGHLDRLSGLHQHGREPGRALPTKGLTLPLMSFGGSAILMNLVALAVVLRVDYENKLLSCAEAAYEPCERSRMSQKTCTHHGGRHRRPHLPRPCRG